MTLLEFARGPALAFALAVFVIGVELRAPVRRAGLPRRPDLSPAREGAPSALAAAWHANLRAMWPRTAFAPSTHFITLNGYAFHVGLALIFFGYAPHIAFIRRVTGLSWPARCPTP